MGATEGSKEGEKLNEGVTVGEGDILGLGIVGVTVGVVGVKEGCKEGCTVGSAEGLKLGI